MALTDEAIERIKGMILDGQLQPGQRLPPEKELSEGLGLSRNSLREAVKALEAMRVLDVRRGDGTYVTSLEPDLLLGAMSFVLDVQRDVTVLEMLEVRAILEPQAAVMAIPHTTPDDISTLRRLVDESRSANNVEDLVQLDVDFHNHINSLSGNGYLASMLSTLSTGTQRARIWRGLAETGSVERTLAEHAAIVDALEAAHVELVRAHSNIHVNGVARWIRANFTPDEG